MAAYTRISCFSLLFVVALLSGANAMAQEEVTETYASTERTTEQTLSYKLGVYRARTSVSLRRFSPYMSGAAGNAVVLVVYEEDADIDERWHLMWQEAIELPGGEGFVDSAALNLSLIADRRYLIGIYLTADPAGYFFDDRAGISSSWADIEGIAWSSPGSNNSVVDPLNDDVDDRFAYHHRITVALGIDNDQDGALSDVDCDDNNPEVYPGAPERCNNNDDDCDDQVDECSGDVWYEDLDGDGYGNGSVTFSGCEGQLIRVCPAGDCDDENPELNPGAEEPICSVEDLNCDGIDGDPDLCAESERIYLDGTCGCSSPTPPTLPALLLLPALVIGLLLRRRFVHPQAIA